MNIPTFLPGPTYAAHPRGCGPVLELPPRWIVIHDTGNTASAKDEAHYAATRTDDRGGWTSAHFYVDATEVVGSTPLDQQAWAAFANANAHGWQIEMCGQDAGDPGAVPAETLIRTAGLVAQLVELGGQPARFVDPAGIAAGTSGITGHLEFTEEEHRSGGHTDPGYRFDWAHFLGLINAALTAPSTTPSPQEDPVNALPLLKVGSTGQYVRNLQALLNAHASYGLVVDGIFGPNTDNAVRSFQVFHQVPNSVTAGHQGDGQCGPRTWAALLDIA